MEKREEGWKEGVEGHGKERGAREERAQKREEGEREGGRRGAVEGGRRSGIAMHHPMRMQLPSRHLEIICIIIEINDSTKAFLQIFCRSTILFA